MPQEIAAPLGVCILPEPPLNAVRTLSYPHYIQEILAHAGVCYQSVALDELGARLPHLRLLVTVGETALSNELAFQLRAWVEAGGGWLGVGVLCGMGELLGAEVEMSPYGSWGGGLCTLGEGYLKPAQREHPVLAHLRLPLHFFNGIAVRTAGADGLAQALDAHQRPTARQALLERRVGQGYCLLIAPDLPGTVVRIQQGIAITRDGVPASDGTAPVSDGLLKSGDGGVLDWIFDRQAAPDVPGLNAFLEPIADQWRELLLRAIFHLAQTLSVTLPVLWFWPRDLPAVGHLSHDTDGNAPESARRLLEVLEEAQVNSTWCVILPGYAPEILRAIRAAGHELATHYDALEHPWSEVEFDRQWRDLCALFAPDVPLSNKNHYLRWEGDTEFFDWCAQRGIRLDQSKGASKAGEAGFNFGTCHLHFPVAPDGRLLDVLELPTPTQDLEVFVPEALAAPLLAAVERNHGMLHLLFHPGHVAKPNVAAALLRAVAQARARGLEWWTARQSNDWERARRQVRWTDYRQEGENIQVTLITGPELQDATLLWLSPAPARMQIGDVAPSVRTTQRWGFDFLAGTGTLPENSATILRWTRD
jgi:hypothetical protein